MSRIQQSGQLLGRLRSSPEAAVFLGIAGLGVLTTVIYWFVSYELAGTVLLAGFSLATGMIGLRLAPIMPRPPDPDRPLLDEAGRIPSPTLAPFALGIGIALAATSLVFGPAPLVVAVVPVAWAARQWLARASAELRATETDRPEPPYDRRG